jgi:hypothetical protein
MKCRKMNEPIVEKTADTAAAGSAFLAGATWLVELELYLQMGATFVAIVAGAAATWYHIERALYMRRKNQEPEV